MVDVHSLQVEDSRFSGAWLCKVNPETCSEETWTIRLNPSRINALRCVHCGFDPALLSFTNLLFYLDDALSMRDGEDHMLLAEGSTSQVSGRALG